MPIFSITALDRRLFGAVRATISAIPNRVKAWLRTALAASVAYPLPQCTNASRHPISTQGVKWAARRLNAVSDAGPIQRGSVKGVHLELPAAVSLLLEYMHG